MKAARTFSVRALTSKPENGKTETVRDRQSVDDDTERRSEPMHDDATPNG